MTGPDEVFIAELRALLPPAPGAPSAAEVAAQRRAVRDLATPVRHARRLRPAGVAALSAALLVAGGAGVAAADGQVTAPLRAVAGAIGLSRPADPFDDARRQVSHVNQAVARGDGDDAAGAVAALQRQLASLPPEDRTRLAPAANAAMTAAAELEGEHHDDERSSTFAPAGGPATTVAVTGGGADDRGSGGGTVGGGGGSSSGGSTSDGSGDRDGGSGSTVTTPTTTVSRDGSGGSDGGGSGTSAGTGGGATPTTTTTTTTISGRDGGGGGHDGGSDPSGSTSSGSTSGGSGG